MHRSACSLPLAALLFASVARIAGAQQPPPAGRPTYPAPASSITIPFAEADDFANLQHTLRLLASVNGGPAHTYTVDTGSVGVVLPADEIPGFNPKAVGNKPGELRYSSSGLKLTGFWTHATLHFLNPTLRQPLAEAAVDVLAVTAGTCTGGGPNAGHCTGNIPHMLGVGFGRGGDSVNGMRGQADNPFVNLAPMNAPEPGTTMHHGYMITREGVTFGLTDPETRGFRFIKLAPAGKQSIDGHVATPMPGSASRLEPPAFTRDYATAPGFLTLGEHNYPMGVVLIDTGLTNMIVEEPNEPSSGELPEGQPAVIHLLGDQLRYSFTTGVPNTSVSPRRETWARYTHGPFINTGLRTLACFDYLYDAENGYLGLRPTCSAK